MIEYTIDGAQQLVRCKMGGETNMVNLVVHIANLSRDPEFNPSYNLIFEVAPDSTFSILPIEHEFKTLMKQWAERRQGVKWAFWVPLGMTHAHMQYILELLNLQDVETRLFEDERTALDWLHICP